MHFDPCSFSGLFPRLFAVVQLSCCHVFLIMGIHAFTSPVNVVSVNFYVKCLFVPMCLQIRITNNNFCLHSCNLVFFCILLCVVSPFYLVSAAFVLQKKIKIVYVCQYKENTNSFNLLVLYILHSRSRCFGP